jgi:hypothetical protein
MVFRLEIPTIVRSEILVSQGPKLLAPELERTLFLLGGKLEREDF